MNTDIWRMVPNEDGNGGQKWRTYACELCAELAKKESHSIFLEGWIEKAIKHGKLNCGHGLKNLEIYIDKGSGCRICLEAMKNAQNTL